MLLDFFGHADAEPVRPGPDPEPEARAILADAVERWDPLAVVALFSGGNDSTCAARIAAETPRFAGCLLADTGVAIPEAHEHARATAARFGWPADRGKDDRVLRVSATPAQSTTSAHGKIARCSP